MQQVSVPKTHTILRAARATGLLLSLSLTALTSLPASASDPQPTPRPGSLAAYASGRPLVAPATGPITITNETLEQHGGCDAVSSSAHVDTSNEADQPPPSPTPVNPKVRRRWQREYARQKKAIAKLESERASTAADLDQLRCERLTARTFAREDALEAELQQLNADLRRERAALASLVREARQEGAVPGWFRGL